MSGTALRQLFIGLVVATLAIGCKSNKDIFSGLSSSTGDDNETKEDVFITTTVERSVPVTDKSDLVLPEVFTAISKEDFLTQVSEAEKSVYGLDKDNLYDYYRLTVASSNGMNCAQYLAMGRRVWNKLRRLAVSIEKHELGYRFRVFKTLDDSAMVSQTATVAHEVINFYCYTNGKNEVMRHLVMIAYESKLGKELHTSGNDLVTDTKIPLVYPRFEALRGDMKNGELRIRDIAFLDANAYYQSYSKSIAAQAIAVP